jgi:hypothetical protein
MEVLEDVCDGIQDLSHTTFVNLRLSSAIIVLNLQEPYQLGIFTFAIVQTVRTDHRPRQPILSYQKFDFARES